MNAPEKKVLISNRTPPIRNYLPSAVALAGFGWLGILFLILFTLPTLGPRWLFFFFLVIALTGTLMPFVAFINFRFQKKPYASVSVIFRESLWAGIFGASLAWLQIGRVLTIGLAFLVAIGIVAVELALRLRERSQWIPEEHGNPES